MNSNTKLDITYIAGIFDAKGTIKTSKSLIVGKVLDGEWRYLWQIEMLWN